MDIKIDRRVAELLAARLCHDLVGPIGAVGNGLELLGDEEFGMADDAMKLTTSSARQASHILQFFRLAYGMAGARVGADYSAIRSEEHTSELQSLMRISYAVFCLKKKKNTNKKYNK